MRKSNPGATGAPAHAARNRARTAACILASLVIAVTAGWRALVAREARAARVAAASGSYAVAQAAIDRWLRYSPGATEPLLLRIRIAIARGRLPEAVELYKKVRSDHRDAGPDIELVGAILAAKVGRLDQAGPILSREFLAAKGPDPLLDEALAKFYLENYDFLRALTVIGRWTADAPHDPKPYLWRTEINARRGDQTDLLIADYREALRRDPDLAAARLGLADQLRKIHRGDEAAAEYAVYIALRPADPAGHLGAGQNALESGDDAAAARHLDRAEVLDPRSALAHKTRAGAALLHGDTKGALAHLDRAVALAPYDLSIRNNRSTVLARLGRPEAARAERAAADRLRAENEQLTSLQSRLFLKPDDLELQLRIARWLLDHGQDRAGVQWAEKVLKERPGEPGASRLLADYYRSHANPGLANFYQLDADHEPYVR